MWIFWPGHLQPQPVPPSACRFFSSFSSLLRFLLLVLYTLLSRQSHGCDALCLFTLFTFHWTGSRLVIHSLLLLSLRALRQPPYRHLRRHSELLAYKEHPSSQHLKTLRRSAAFFKPSSLLDHIEMELARALTSRRKQVDQSSTLPNRAASMKSGHGTIKRSAISSPLELLSSTNNLAYNAPNIYNSADESDSSFTLSASSRATTPETSTPSPVEPNHLSTYFSAARSVPTRVSKDSIENETPMIPQRVPSHTKRSHQAAARKRAESITPPAPPNAIHNLAPMGTCRPVDAFLQKSDMNHPFGAELAQVNEVAEGFGARDAIIMDEEEQYLMANGFCKFGAEDYISEVQGLFGGINNNPFSPLAAVWI